jgi:peptidoglycan hydrolase-like protein with peptidoglycan-binding domain
MRSAGKIRRHAAGRPSRNANHPVRATSPEALIQNRAYQTTRPFARRAGPRIPVALYVFGAIAVFFLSFAITRWLPDFMNGRDRISEPTLGTITPTVRDTAESLHEDNGGNATPIPVSLIIFRRSTPSNDDAIELPPHTEASPPQVTAPESVETITTPRQLDLQEIEDAKRVQQRLIDLGFLFGVADGIWGPRSSQALQDFKAAKNLGANDAWDEATQRILLIPPDPNAPNTSNGSFIGRWGSDVDECRKSPLIITASRAEASGVACEFLAPQRENLHTWRLQARCTSDGERWNANIRFALSGRKLTWSSERGTTTYMRCPM